MPKEVPEDKKLTNLLQVKLSRELTQRLDAHCEKHAATKTKFVRKAIEEKLERVCRE
jgi:predicted DNA-binding protein